jgi:hypothetical protein
VQGAFPRGKFGRNVKLNNHFHLVSRSVSTELHGFRSWFFTLCFYRSKNHARGLRLDGQQGQVLRNVRILALCSSRTNISCLLRASRATVLHPALFKTNLSEGRIQCVFICFDRSAIQLGVLWDAREMQQRYKDGHHIFIPTFLPFSLAFSPPFTLPTLFLILHSFTYSQVNVKLPGTLIEHQAMKAYWGVERYGSTHSWPRH